MLNNTCIITGAALCLEHKNAIVYGDLFLQGDQFIFNSNFLKGEICYHKSDVGIRNNVVTLQPDCPYFERRGVFVIPLPGLVFNPLALDYVFKEAFEGGYKVNATTGKLSLKETP